MERTTGWISPLLYIASSSFCQPQYNQITFLLHCVPVLLLGADLECVIWLPTGFVIISSHIFWSDLDSLQRSFLHCYLFVMLCNEQSIGATPISLLSMQLINGRVLQLAFCFSSLFSPWLIIGAPICMEEYLTDTILSWNVESQLCYKE